MKLMIDTNLMIADDDDLDERVDHGEVGDVMMMISRTGDEEQPSRCGRRRLNFIEYDEDKMT